ncbi:MAG TPA: glycine oxidase ThiO [Thermoleophilaceae bacterium]
MPERSGHDVVVVGAGLIGLSCAWRASLRGLSVLVVDAVGPGAGASSVAAGMLAPVTEAEFGEEELLRLNLEAQRRWPAFAEELGAELHHRREGALVVAVDRDDAEALQRLHQFQRSLGLDAEWLTPSECRRLEPGLSPRCAGGISAPHEQHLDPLAVVSALAGKGIEIAQGDPVVAVEASGVRLGSGATLAADQVVIAAGAWSGSGIEGLPELPVRPLKGQILALRRPLDRPLADHLIRTPRCYILDRGDGRVVVGGTMEERGFDTTVTVDGVYRLLEAAWEVLPDVSELQFEGAKAGLRPATPDNLPVIGRGELQGVIWATGSYRNGVLHTAIVGEAVAELLTGGEAPDAVKPFSPERFLVGVR